MRKHRVPLAVAALILGVIGYAGCGPGADSNGAATKAGDSSTTATSNAGGAGQGTKVQKAPMDPSK